MRIFAIIIVCCLTAAANKYTDQLYEDLLYYYNKVVRPVKNATDVLTVRFGSSLIRIIEVDEVNQVLTTNLWLEMHWRDAKLTWDAEQYGNITKLHVPSDQIWTPDIVLYNNADGDPDITIMADAMVYSDGTIVWKPPAIYKSFCSINIEYFPFDEQKCQMKFGGWSYNGFFLDMRQIPVRPSDQIFEMKDWSGDDIQYMDMGMDLSNFYESAEWDLINLTSERHEAIYPGCCGQENYIDVRFNMTLRRKTLFYTVNLVIPCMLIAILTTFVFYIPAGDHKITFAISILVTLTVFYLVLVDLIPPTSLVIPLIGKYLLFTMMLVAVSILVSVVNLNLYHRSGATHQMPEWMKWLFLDVLPKPLCIRPQNKEPDDDDHSSVSDLQGLRRSSTASRRPSPYFMSVAQYQDSQMRLTQLANLRGMHPDLVRRMCDNVAFIADHFRAMEDENRVSEEWSYVSMVIDRLFLIIFTIVNLIGTGLIIMQAPAIYDHRPPLATWVATQPLGHDTLQCFSADPTCRNLNFTG